jgi:ketosteroid isomerase-like protein
LEKVLSLYTDNAVLIPPAGPNIYGKENIRTNYEGLFGANSLKITNEIWETIISGTWAYSTGANCVTVTSKTDGTKGTAYSKYLMVLKMGQQGQWKISRLIWANQPAEEAREGKALHCRPLDEKE